jgi:hypothetical protein
MTSVNEKPPLLTMIPHQEQRYHSTSAEKCKRRKARAWLSGWERLRQKHFRYFL